MQTVEDGLKVVFGGVLKEQLYERTEDLNSVHHIKYRRPVCFKNGDANSYLVIEFNKR